MSTSPNQSRDKADLLSRLDAAWADLRTALAAIPAGDLETVRDASGWSVADHLAHVTAWERWKVALLRGESRAVSLGVSEDLYGSDDTDAINQAIRAASVGQTAEAALAAAERTHSDLTALVTTLSDEDLRQPYGQFMPDQPAIEGDPTLLGLCAFTLDHIAEHVGLLGEMRPA